MAFIKLRFLVSLFVAASASSLVSTAQPSTIALCPFLDTHYDPHLDLLCLKSSSKFTPKSWSYFSTVYRRFHQDVYQGIMPSNGMLFSAKTYTNGVFESNRYVMFAHSSNFLTTVWQEFVMEMIWDLAIEFKAPPSVHDWLVKLP